MTTIPTVRVKNPAAPESFMLINQSDLREHHEVWPQQAPDYVKAPLPVLATDSREAQVAVRIVGKLITTLWDGMSPEVWAAKTSDERAAFMEAQEAKMDGGATMPTPKNWKAPK